MIKVTDKRGTNRSEVSETKQNASSSTGRGFLHLVGLAFITMFVMVVIGALTVPSTIIDPELDTGWNETYSERIENERRVYFDSRTLHEIRIDDLKEEIAANTEVTKFTTRSPGNECIATTWTLPENLFQEVDTEYVRADSDGWKAPVAVITERSHRDADTKADVALYLAAHPELTPEIVDTCTTK